jgi:hypothetical protein
MALNEATPGVIDDLAPSPLIDCASQDGASATISKAAAGKSSFFMARVFEE